MPQDRYHKQSAAITASVQGQDAGSTIGRFLAQTAVGSIDPPSEQSFDRLTSLLSHHFCVPIAAIAFIDGERLFVSSSAGLPIRQIQRRLSFWAQCLDKRAPVIACDTKGHHRFATHPLVVGGPKIRFYAGVPIILSGGQIVGTLWIADSKPKQSFPASQVGGLELYAAMAAEVIERKHLEDCIEQLRKEKLTLERTVEEQIELSNARLAFLSNMSHEIRTPMNGVMGMMQLLAKSRVSDEQRDYIAVAERSGNALLSIVDDVLDLSKIETGNLGLEIAPIDLERKLNDIAAIWGQQAKAKGLHLTTRIVPGTPTNVMGDPLRIRQILSNLVSNAIKFTPSGAVDIVLDRVSSSGDDVLLRFSIKDTGIGITPDQLKGLFQPFVQADPSTTRKFGGSGLGLAICKRLIGLMGGSIEVLSAPNQGTTFQFTISVSPSNMQQYSAERSRTLDNPKHASEKQSQNLACATSGPARADRRPVRILVVEDDPTNRLVTVAQLSKLGYQADVVEDGAAAVVAMQGSHYSLILMDCAMPIMDGYQATRKIRELGFHEIPIIAITAYVMGDNRETCLNSGMDHVLSKPVIMSELAEILEEYCPNDPQEAVTGASAEVDALTFDPRTVFDPTSLLERLMNDSDLAGVVVTGFVDNWRTVLECLRRYINLEDGRGLRIQAHALKGGAAAVSANRLSTAAHALERSAEQGSRHLWGGLLAQLVKEANLFVDVVHSTGWTPGVVVTK